MALLSVFHCNCIQKFSFCVAPKKETPTYEVCNFRVSHSFKCNFSLANFINGLKVRRTKTATKKQEEWTRKSRRWERIREISVTNLQRCLWACQTLTKDLALCDTSLQNLHQTVPVWLYPWLRASLSLFFFLSRLCIRSVSLSLSLGGWTVKRWGNSSYLHTQISRRISSRRSGVPFSEWMREAPRLIMCTDPSFGVIVLQCLRWHMHLADAFIRNYSRCTVFISLDLDHGVSIILWIDV